MRLINADSIKFRPYYDDYVDYDGYINDLKTWQLDDILSDRVDNAPTVEAIPINWIKNYIIPFQEFHDRLSEERKENDAAGWVVDVLEGMLKRWEKENE